MGKRRMIVGVQWDQKEAIVREHMARLDHPKPVFPWPLPVIRRSGDRGEPVPRRVLELDLPGHFNCSIVLRRGERLLASRPSENDRRICLTLLRDDWTPGASSFLELSHPRITEGFEDPRLCFIDQQLHVSVCGLENLGSELVGHQLVARINHFLEAEDLVLPELPARGKWEKNWAFFDQAGQMHAVYSIDPHVILTFAGHRAERRAVTHSPMPWPATHYRGGAPPIRVDDEYWHVCHTTEQLDEQFEYCAWLYTFEARAPWRIRRMLPTPLMIANPADRAPRWNKNVVFPCGALIDGGDLVMSYGYHDKACRLAFFDLTDLQARLVAAPSSPADDAGGELLSERRVVPLDPCGRFVDVLRQRRV